MREPIDAVPVLTRVNHSHARPVCHAPHLLFMTIAVVGIVTNRTEVQIRPLIFRRIGETYVHSHLAFVHMAIEVNIFAHCVRYSKCVRAIDGKCTVLR